MFLTAYAAFTCLAVFLVLEAETYVQSYSADNAVTWLVDWLEEREVARLNGK